MLLSGVVTVARPAPDLNPHGPDLRKRGKGRFQPGLCYRAASVARTPLTRGQFYGGTDGTKFIKTAPPMRLSCHPAAPLTEEEVIARARTDS